MELRKLLEGVDTVSITGTIQKKIEGVAYHSRQVRQGFLFSALRGWKSDGHRYIEEALQRGAAAVILEEDREISATKVLVSNSRKALARIAGNFYGNPSAKLKLIGVTGTNGKTTVTYLLESIFKRMRYAVGVIGTVNYRFGQTIIAAPNTTPESPDLQRVLNDMVEEGISHVIMEVSSHGLDLDRVYGCQFDGAIFTNLTQDHLDYHLSLEHYFESKKRLFSECLMTSPKAGRFAVTNQDDPRGEAIIEGIRLPIYRYGLGSSCPISADQVTSSLDGLSFRIRTLKGSLGIHSNLIGGFNLSNILASVATGIAMGLPLDVLKDGIESLKGVPGRLEKIENQKGLHVFVDYAHTPDALERSLLGLRSVMEDDREGLQRERIITVFGCGGDRDRTKRPLMGEVAGRWSDLVVLTSDNPRTEDPLSILDEVERGVRRIGLTQERSKDAVAWRTQKGYLKIPDRREAIHAALRLAQASDIVLIAGKGHEDYQIVGTTKHPFDDRVEAKRALEGT